MLQLKLEEILISANRQRREFDPQKLQELADSIDKHGLFNAIVVRKVDEGWQLVQGERRLRAIRDHLLPLGGKVRYAGGMLDDGFVPAIPIGELSELAAEEAELEENIRRTDLTWQERAAATARLAALRARQAAADGTAAPSVAEIAEEVRGSSEGANHEATRREIILAKHLGNPTVAAAKSVDEAWKALKREEETRKNAELAVTVGRTFSAALHEAVNSPCEDWFQSAPADTFDVILTDPPYGMGADEFGDSGGKAVGAHAYEDSWAAVEPLLLSILENGYRVAKPQAHLYMFCDIDHFLQLRTAAEARGWWVHRTPLIWHKPNAIRAPWPEHGPRRTYETILYAVKGKRPVTRLYPDVLTHNPDENLGHGAQKPVALFTALLERSIRPGDTVLDPCMGTGTIFPAAHMLKCRATGIERDPAAFGIAIGRLNKLKAEDTK